MNEHRSLPAALLVAVLAAAALLGFAMPAAALAATGQTAKAFDFFHAKQQSSGGFADSGSLAMDLASTTPWAMMAIAAGGEKVGTWDPNGKSPLEYLQSTDLQARARGTENAPQFYAKVMLAYAAIGRSGLIGSAGSPAIDLISKLELYRASDGHYGRDTSGDRSYADVSTTTWVILALRAAKQSQNSESVSEAAAWLVGSQNANGGWSFTSSDGSATETASTVDQTAAAIQALVAAGKGSSSAVTTGLQWIKDHQRSDGGFPSAASDPRSNAESSAWALQAAIATGNAGGTWAKSARTYLTSLRQANGSYAHSTSSSGGSSMMTTTQVVVALAGEAYPFERSGKDAAAFRPKVSSFKPSDGAKFTSTNDVTVSAGYSDVSDGTGVPKDNVHVYVDGTNRTSKATIGSSSIKLTLVDVPNGSHSVEIRLKDRAGNSSSSKHTFTVSVSTGGSGGSGSGGYDPSGGGSSGYTPSGTRTPSPTTTLYPTPTPATTGTPGVTPTSPGSVTGTPLTPTPGASGSPVPSPSATVTGEVAGGGGGAGGAIGVTLLAMLPAGAALSYLVHRRQTAALAAAGSGKVLPGGGTPWQRFKARLPWTS